MKKRLRIAHDQDPPITCPGCMSDLKYNGHRGGGYDGQQAAYTCGSTWSSVLEQDDTWQNRTFHRYYTCYEAEIEQLKNVLGEVQEQLDGWNSTQ